MRDPTRGHVGLAVAVAAMAGGCGGSDEDAVRDSAKRFSGEKQRVAQVIEDLEAAGKAGDIDRLCKEILAPQAVADAERHGERCKDGVDELRSEVDHYGGKAQARRFPNLAAVIPQAGTTDHDAEFAEGLDAIIAGLTARAFRA